MSESIYEQLQELQADDQVQEFYVLYLTELLYASNHAPSTWTVEKVRELLTNAGLDQYASHVVRHVQGARNTIALLFYSDEQVVSAARTCCESLCSYTSKLSAELRENVGANLITVMTCRGTLRDFGYVTIRTFALTDRVRTYEVAIPPEGQDLHLRIIK